MRHKNAFIRIIFLLIYISILSACSSNAFKEQNLAEAEQYFRVGMKAMERERYELALEQFSELETNYPFHKLTEHARLEMLYAYFEQEEYASVKALAAGFLTTYPRSNQLDYVLYMKGIAAFMQGFDRFVSHFNVDLSKRDIGKSEEAFADFSRLLQQYPESIYAPDARKRMIYLRNRLAANEIHIAEFYLQKKAYLAALNRGQYVLQNYASTPSTKAALGIMIKAYKEMQMPEKAAEVQRILDLN